MMDGYRNQPFIENLLRPYTNKMVRHPSATCPLAAVPAPA
jgi:hypothetical protein